jgi:hypothetical protein
MVGGDDCHYARATTARPDSGIGETESDKEASRRLDSEAAAIDPFAEHAEFAAIESRKPHNSLALSGPGRDPCAAASWIFLFSSWRSGGVKDASAGISVWGGTASFSLSRGDTAARSSKSHEMESAAKLGFPRFKLFWFPNMRKLTQKPVTAALRQLRLFPQKMSLHSPCGCFRTQAAMDPAYESVPKTRFLGWLFFTGPLIQDSISA